jgi:hypothetical protein
MSENEQKAATDREWEKRTLCADESCIGVVGPDGHCKECGLAFPGWKSHGASVPANGPADKTEAAALSEPEPEPMVDEPEADLSPDDDDEDTSPDEAVGEDNGDWDSRVLCRDESCIGVIGPDGRCKECGLSLEEPSG